MPVAALPDVDLYYELHGPAAAPPLLLIHGALETFHSGWRKQIPLFSQTYRLIGPDLRGHGHSNNPANQLDLRQLADDMKHLLTHLGYETAHVCGFSGGGSVALFMAVRHLACLRSLTLVSHNFELDQVRTGASQFWNPERIAREEPRWWAFMQENHRSDIPQLLGWWAAEDTLRPNFAPPDLAPLTVPTLVMGGDSDPIVPLAQTVKLFENLPGARLCILPGVGHGLPSRRPELFNRILLDFLESVEDDLS
jgi:pimeloyl-ACP methyl ester carboxylesterase